VPERAALDEQQRSDDDEGDDDAGLTAIAGERGRGPVEEGKDEHETGQ
jgi:hypothetical protein